MAKTPLGSGTYLARYRYQGHTCGFDFVADSMEDAEARLKALKDSATLDGRLDCTIPWDISEEEFEQSFFRGKNPTTRYIKVTFLILNT